MTTAQSNAQNTGNGQFEQELVALRPQLLKFALSLTKDATHAEDLVQETHIKALQHPEQFEMGTNMRAWLCTILRNLLLSEKRRSWRMLQLDQEFAERTIPEIAAGQDRHLSSREELATLIQALGCISKEQRDSIVATRHLGISYDNAALTLQCPMGTIKSRVSRGARELRGYMENSRVPPVDLSSWAHATRGLSKNHPYFPVAQAYEELYGIFSEIRGTAST